MEFYKNKVCTYCKNDKYEHLELLLLRDSYGNIETICPECLYKNLTPDYLYELKKCIDINNINMSKYYNTETNKLLSNIIHMFISVGMSIVYKNIYINSFNYTKLENDGFIEKLYRTEDTDYIVSSLFVAYYNIYENEKSINEILTSFIDDNIKRLLYDFTPEYLAVLNNPYLATIESDTVVNKLIESKLLIEDKDNDTYYPNKKLIKKEVLTSFDRIDIYKFLILNSKI